MRMKMRRRRRRRRKSWKRRQWKRTSLVTCMTISLPALSLAIWHVEVIGVDHWDCWSHQRRSLRWLKSSKWITEIVLFVSGFLFVGTDISCYFSCFIFWVKGCCCWESHMWLWATLHIYISFLCTSTFFVWNDRQLVFTLSDLNVNWCSLCPIWLSAGVHFVWFGCQLVFSLSDLIASWCSVCLIASWCSVCLIWS